MPPEKAHRLLTVNNLFKWKLSGDRRFKPQNGTIFMESCHEHDTNTIL